MTPSAWHRPNAHEETMIQFQNIDQYIDKLLILGDNRQEGNEEEETKDKTERKEEKGKKKKESEARKEREASIMFFADMFGRKSLQNMVGNISFFSAFASLVTSAEAVKPTLGESGLSVEGMNDRSRPYPGLRRPFTMPWKGRANLRIQRRTQFSTVDRHFPDTRIEVDGVQNSRIHVSRRTLIKDSTHAAVEGVTDLASTRGTGARQISEELGSKSFGPQLLRLIGTIYMKSESILAFDNSGSDGTSPEEDFAVVYSSTLKSRLRVLLKRVDKLRCHLRTSKNDGEVQRALTEDIAGTILLLCWQGVRCEVEQVLTKVVDAVVNDKLVDRGTREARAKRLRNIGEMFVQNATDRASEYGSCALQR
ncbi:hypothetical protein PISMIDRAFT_536947 [Pisolithus microcarpus 441]|uniref:DNAJ-containing protein X-domain domain-containing protein n=1 Tax=Pisolithus microcarpus 441 TaxID=765257 RepID=A0A0C9Y1H3_9AGAM|nr:hypothetical protein PISMIDRAFT_536947 [Pisolithus microcarpus 441]